MHGKQKIIGENTIRAIPEKNNVGLKSNKPSKLKSSLDKSQVGQRKTMPSKLKSNLDVKIILRFAHILHNLANKRPLIDFDIHQSKYRE